MNISSFPKCANCGACSNICPTDAITIEENGLFYHPVVDEDKCIDCRIRRPQDEEERLPPSLDHPYLCSGKGQRHELFHVHERSEEGRYRSE